MPQNETQSASAQDELAELSSAAAGLLRRRRGLGKRRTAALAPLEAQAPINNALAAISDRPKPQKQALAVPPSAPTEPTRPPKSAEMSPQKAPSQPTGAPATSPAPDASGYRTLEALAAAIESCSACGLSRSRQQAFASHGSGSSGVLFIDETPGAFADAGRSPFEGPSGELLGSIVTKGMGLTLEAVQLISLVKCQPRAGAPPEPSELSMCRGWLERQAQLIGPKVVVTLGRPVAAAILGQEAPLGRLRGQVHDALGSKVVATFHPEFLVRSPAHKKDAWEDIQLAMRIAGLPLPTRK